MDTTALNWHRVIAGQWHYREHINVLELRAVELAVRWCASRPGTAGLRLFLLSDSQVVVAGMLKGRSSSYSLLPTYRRLACFDLATGTRLLPIWIRSGDNPADAASRGLA